MILPIAMRADELTEQDVDLLYNKAKEMIMNTEEIVKPPTITYEDFLKVEMKTAVVAEAENHPKADKLMVLKVRCGEELRQIVAGIRPDYTPETMIGKTIVIVMNLEPRSLRGVESQGMLLAVRDDEILSLVTLDKLANNGLKVG